MAALTITLCPTLSPKLLPPSLILLSIPGLQTSNSMCSAFFDYIGQAFARYLFCARRLQGAKMNVTLSSHLVFGKDGLFPHFHPVTLVLVFNVSPKIASKQPTYWLSGFLHSVELQEQNHLIISTSAPVPGPFKLCGHTLLQWACSQLWRNSSLESHDPGLAWEYVSKRDNPTELSHKDHRIILWRLLNPRSADSPPGSHHCLVIILEGNCSSPTENGSEGFLSPVQELLETLPASLLSPPQNQNNCSILSEPSDVCQYYWQGNGYSVLYFLKFFY